jgi:2',3'-cyclic-nucleotide 2'-phosphodiesterase (5'-nucleotidase family)
LSSVTGVTLLYTANLAGDLSLLPRLFVLIQRERQSASGPVLLLDLGDTCALDVRICRATEGRAPLMVLDGMGYDAALVGGPEQVSIPVASLQRLRGQITMAVIPWNRHYVLTKRDVTITLAAGNVSSLGEQPVVFVDRSTAALPQVDDQVIQLGDVASGCLARVDIAWPVWTVKAARLVQISADTPPDPTISAVVEFVHDEAQYYSQQQGGSP